jgi:hypothetical protein
MDEEDYSEAMAQARAEWLLQQEAEEDGCICAQAGKCDVCVERAIDRAEMLEDR